MGSTALYVCVGTRQRFEHWCRETFDCSAHHAEYVHVAIGLHSRDEIRKLFGYHGPMVLVDLGDADGQLLNYVTDVVSQENYLELLRLENT